MKLFTVYNKRIGNEFGGFQAWTFSDLERANRHALSLIEIGMPNVCIARWGMRSTRPSWPSLLLSQTQVQRMLWSPDQPTEFERKYAAMQAG